MIYFDNSATTLIKPPEVAEAVAYAINHFGNAGRSFHDTAMQPGREIFAARAEIAALIGLDDPLNVAFTANSTESLNLVISALIKKEDRIVTTVTEHNSVLRPLYLKKCPLDFWDCDDNGVLQVGKLEKLLKPDTKFMVCTHGSNVTGNITDVKRVYNLCKTRGITLILDISQTFGLIPVTIDMADIFCFTGHKGLFGPQGTGGIIVSGTFPFDIVKTGGSGFNSFAAYQPAEMPDVFEAGTLNSHGLYGLKKGVEFIRKTGIDAIHEKETALTVQFYNGVRDIKGIRFYGDFSGSSRLPVVSLNIEGLSAAELSGALWDQFEIATRPGSHCAPLLHKRFGTADTGIVRFSFSYFNTDDEIQTGITALQEIASSIK